MTRSRADDSDAVERVPRGFDHDAAYEEAWRSSDSQRT
jgi:hypothetical protein